MLRVVTSGKANRMAYKIALFMHICGVLGLFAGIGIELVGAIGFRGARTVDQVRTNARVVKVTVALFPAATVVVISAGVYMALTQWSFRTPFVVVGLITLLVIVALGATIQGKQWQMVEKAADGLPNGPVPESLGRLINDPVAWSSMAGGVFGALAVVFLMTIKPGWAAAIAIAVVAYAVGGLAGWLFAKPRAEAAVVRVAD